MQGWVKLHRKLLDNPIMKEPELLQLFIYCLLRANHEPAYAFWGKEQLRVERGQFITGRFELSNDLKQKPITTYKRLLKLEKLNYLNIKSNNKNSLVTIVNWDFYQSLSEENNNKSNNKVTTNEQQSNTDKNERIITTTTTDIGEIQSYFENNGFGLMTPGIAQDIISYLDVDHIEPEVILAALQKSLKKNIRTWDYASKIISSCYQQGITTMEQYKAAQLAFEAKKKIKQAVDNAAAGRNQPPQRFGQRKEIDFNAIKGTDIFGRE